ncbi:MAG TPA: hypothetical protein PK297_12960 [Spirochaetota bacterium]|nr:hypothetical protein [Spirochaetota bacterium]
MKKRRHFPFFLLVVLAVFVVVVGTPFGLDAGLTNLQAPLADRILMDDGDFAEVPIWKWANDITGDKAAIVMSKTGELDSFILHRTWRRGQTVGQAVRAVEDYLGRFRVHFERDTMTFVSLSANELQKKTLGASGYQGSSDESVDDGLSWKIAVFGGIVGDESGEFGSSPGILIGGEVAAPIFGMFDLVVRIEFQDFFGDELLDLGMVVYYYKAVAPQVLFRFLPWQDAIVTPYIHAGFAYNIQAVDVDEYATPAGFPLESSVGNSLGFVFGGGLRIGPPESFMLMFELGWRTGDFKSFMQFRGGLAIEL